MKGEVAIWSVLKSHLLSGKEFYANISCIDLEKTYQVLLQFFRTKVVYKIGLSWFFPFNNLHEPIAIVLNRTNKSKNKVIVGKNEYRDRIASDQMTRYHIETFSLQFFQVIVITQ